MIWFIIALLIIVPAIILVYLMAWDVKEEKHLSNVTLEDISKECPGWGWFLFPGFSIIVCIMCSCELLYNYLKNKPIL